MKTVTRGKYRLAKAVECGYAQHQRLTAGQIVSVHVNEWENGARLVTVVGWCKETAQEVSSSIGFETTTAHEYLGERVE